MEEYIVQVNQGKLRGTTKSDYKGNKYFSFQGIPYAKPPLRELRFKAPLPAENWIGILDARKEASSSLSRHDVTGNIVGSEDCLYLNIYTPQISRTEKEALKPVVVWVHGGLFVGGSGTTEIHGPEYLMTEDIVLVTINYRLGILGFLSLDDSTLEVPGNAALKDIVMSLRWVQENIETFCGDPRRVTLAGHSAGAALVHYMVLSPMAKGLFHRAILQSGCSLCHWAVGSRKTIEIAKIVGCENGTEKDILDYLSLLSPNELFEIQEKINTLPHASKNVFVAPVIEKVSGEPAFLDKHPLDIIRTGNYNKVPMIIGYTSQEGMISDIVYGKPRLDVDYFSDFQSQIPYYYNITVNSEFSKKAAKKIKEFYFENISSPKDITQRFYTMQTDILFLNGIYMTIANHMKNLDCPIYFYKFSFDTSLNMLKTMNHLTEPGVCHGDELGYIFKNIYHEPIELNSLEAKYVDVTVKLWTNFVKTGNPNSSENDPLLDVFWEPVKQGRYNYLDINNKLTTGVNLDIERMVLWNEISATNPNASKF